MTENKNKCSCLLQFQMYFVKHFRDFWFNFCGTSVFVVFVALLQCWIRKIRKKNLPEPMVYRLKSYPYRNGSCVRNDILNQHTWQFIKGYFFAPQIRMIMQQRTREQKTRACEGQMPQSQEHCVRILFRTSWSLHKKRTHSPPNAGDDYPSVACQNILKTLR